MVFKTLSGGDIDITKEKLDAFKLRLAGPVLAPGDAGFDDSGTVWNKMITRQPALAVQCIGSADVIAAVQFALENNILVCIKGGGHNIAGLALADGALLLDMSLMRGVWVDAKNRIAHAQAGCLLGDVDRETQLHGLAAVLGFVSKTGIAGLTLGGGFGYLTRRFGWTTDNVLQFELVTSEGKIVCASDNENQDLFWGLRGGGGNFGVVTSIDYKLYPVGPEILGGLVAWPASEAPKVLELYKNISKDAPVELTLVAMMRPAPPAPWLPKEIHGKPIVGLLACYSGSVEEGEKLAGRIKGFGKPAGDILIRRPYAQLQALLDATQPKGRRYYWKSEYLKGIDDGLTDKVIEHAGKIQSPHSAVILFQLGGAVDKLKNDHSPVGNRDARYVFNISASWESDGDDEKNISWASAAWNDMKKYSTGGTYINFLTDDEGPERTETALRGSMKRLKEIKSKWDPQNFFRTNKNIPAAG